MCLRIWREREREIPLYKEIERVERMFGVPACFKNTVIYVGRAFSPAFVGLSASVCDVLWGFCKRFHILGFFCPSPRASRGSKGFLDNRSKDVADHVQLHRLLMWAGDKNSPPRLSGFKCSGLCVCDVISYDSTFLNFSPPLQGYSEVRRGFRGCWDSRAVFVPRRNLDCELCQVVFFQMYMEIQTTMLWEKPPICTRLNWSVVHHQVKPRIKKYVKQEYLSQVTP